MAFKEKLNMKKSEINQPLDYFYLIQDNIRLILSFIIVTNFLLIFLLKFSINLKNKLGNFVENIKKNNKEVLIIIAHPDDEAMFFLPTINFLIKNNFKIRLLCLTNGNYYGLGKTREKEFEKVCKLLKIEDIKLIDNPLIQDNFKEKWKEEAVEKTLSDYFQEENNLEKIGNIITFDERGVTNHPNHISCSEGFM